MKKCSKCGVEKELYRFYFYKKRNEYVQPCRTCMSLRDRQRWASDASLRRRRKDKKVARRNICRDFIFSYLLSHPCIDCGEGDPLVLQFDHRDRETKSYPVAVMVTCGWALDAVKKEVAKCDVRCANCHIKKTTKQFNWWKNKDIINLTF